MLTLKETAPFTRTELAQELDRNQIGNRMLFGGNLVRQPAFVQLRKDQPDAFRVAGEEHLESGKRKADIEEKETYAEPASFQFSTCKPASPLPGADRIMNQTLFLGTYPGLSQDQIDFIIQVIREFVAHRMAH